MGEEPVPIYTYLKKKKKKTLAPLIQILSE